MVSPQLIAIKLVHLEKFFLAIQTLLLDCLFDLHVPPGISNKIH